MKSIKLVVFLLLILLTGCSNSNKLEVKNVEKGNIPTLFIHGYSGTSRTMKKMITSLEKVNAIKQEMEITVFEDGHLEVDTKLENQFENNNPGINLVFDSNKSSQWDQAEWIKSALGYLKEEFNVEQVNVVGFSMGGISSFLYMENFSQEVTQPKIKKLVAIGAPFNEFVDDNKQLERELLEKGPRQISEQLANYENLVSALDKESSFFLIGGQISETQQSDGTVPLNSSLGIYSLLAQNNFSVKHHLIYGNEAKHSLLKKNPEVINQVQEFLFEN